MLFAENDCAFADAIAAPGTPPQFSLPHSPVANASVIVFAWFATMSSTSGVRVPGTIVEITLVFQFMLIDVSLYAPKINPAGAVPPPDGGGGGFVGPGGGFIGPPGGGGGGFEGPPPAHVTGFHSAGT